MTTIETILDRAKEYPDRPAIVAADGRVTLYRDVATELGDATEWIFRSSGTTGSPKTCSVTDAQMQKRIARFTSDGRKGLSGSPNIFSLVHWSTAVGQAVRFHTLLNGKTYMHRGASSEPERWLALCEQYAIDVIVLAPGRSRFPSWEIVDPTYRFRNLFLVGDPISQRARERLQTKFGTVYLNYGSTEAGPAIAETTLDVTAQNERIIGVPCSDLTIEIDDGLVRMKGDTVVSEYIDDPVTTAKMFRDGWFYPGDLGHFEGDLLVIDGRI